VHEHAFAPTGVERAVREGLHIGQRIRGVQELDAAPPVPDSMSVIVKSER